MSKFTTFVTAISAFIVIASPGAAQSVDDPSGPFIGANLGAGAHGLDLDLQIDGVGAGALEGLSVDTQALGVTGGWVWRRPAWQVSLRGEAQFDLDSASLTAAFDAGPALAAHLRRDDGLFVGVDAGWRPTPASLLYASAGWNWTALEVGAFVGAESYMETVQFDGPSLGVGLGAAISEDWMVVMEARQEFLREQTVTLEPGAALGLEGGARQLRFGLVWRPAFNRD